MRNSVVRHVHGFGRETENPDDSPEEFKCKVHIYDTNTVHVWR